MDRRWTIEEWAPTVLPGTSWVQRTEKEVKETIAQLRYRTNEITQHPYSPQLWLERSRLLLILGYPELGVGDAYKAKILCNAFDVPQNFDLIEKVKQSMGMNLNRFQKLTTIRSKQKEAVIDSNESVLSKIKLGVYQRLVLGLEQCLSIGEAIYHCKQGMSEFPLDSFLYQRLQSLEAMSNKPKIGGFMAQSYPWMKDEHIKRTAQVLSEAMAHIEGISDDQCTIKESNLAGTSSSKKKTVRWMDQASCSPLARSSSIKAGSSKLLVPARSLPVTQSDFLGVFARKRIRAGSHLLTDVTITGVASVKTSNNCENCYDSLGTFRYSRVCCNTEYCSALCRDLATNAYHRVTCGKIPTTNATVSQHTGTYDSCYRAYNDVNLDLDLYNRLLLRVLASSKAKSLHPLEHETAARLASRSNARMQIPFSLIANIITPLRMLEVMNVDIFSDTKFETWVLTTLWYRIHVHKHTKSYKLGGERIAINPCFSFFNHSCRPNASWHFDGDGTKIAVWANRDIREGEEIFVSYTNLDFMKKQERAEALKRWLGGPCRCAKCAAE